MRTLIQLYEVLKFELEDKTFSSICFAIFSLHIQGIINLEEKLRIIRHFDSLPRPLEATKFSPYYFRKYDKAPRIKFINEIIKKLEEKDDKAKEHVINKLKPKLKY